MIETMLFVEGCLLELEVVAAETETSSVQFREATYTKRPCL